LGKFKTFKRFKSFKPLRTAKIVFDTFILLEV